MSENPTSSGERDQLAEATASEHPDVARVFHALGDPTRRAMVEMLGRAPRTVSGLAAALNITLTAVGQHLLILEECGLARTEKLGRVRTCSLHRSGLDALEHWVRERRTPLEHGLDRLGELLAEEVEGKNQQS